MDREIKDRLSELVSGRAEFDAPLAVLTTFGLGGPAEVLVQPESVDELVRVLDYIRAKGLPAFILGGGSNVLFRDGGFAGVVIRLGSGFSGTAVLGSEGDEVLVEAGAAAPLARLISLTRREGLSGLEFMAGIPGWVGGALVMNAGAQGGEIGQAVFSLTVVSPEGRSEEIGRDQIQTGYRWLKLPEGTLIIKAVFSLGRSTPEQVKARIDEILARRLAGQPSGVKSAGCVFRNPPGRFAGRLIDQAGFKGLAVGRAWVAEEHANFIVHQGQATSGEVIELLERVRAGVRDRFGVELEPEIKIVGQDKEAGSA